MPHATLFIPLCCLNFFYFALTLKYLGKWITLRFSSINFLNKIASRTSLHVLYYKMLSTAVPSSWPDSRRLLMSSVRRPSRRHISKTKQDRPTVNTEHYFRKLAQLILLPQSDPAPYAPPHGDTVWFQITIGPPVRLCPQTTAVANRERPSSYRKCCQLS